MTDVLRPRSGTLEAAPALPGRLVAESDRAISVRVTEGTWTFDRADVLDIDDCATGELDAAPDGRAVLVRIRPGATADFTQRLRIELTERPMTLPQRPSPARGDEQLRTLTERWARGLRLPEITGTGGATWTFCQTRTSGRSDDGVACDSLD
ncbi:hypothetical protein GZH49_14320 [Nocardia terpenica]|uniref:hypothetical protein n=1 Tax=Nocardia terpenica TaxID=455432 RepID=UPI002FE1F309